jgi:formylglycine-generating enzyme required for sulfatase activity
VSDFRLDSYEITVGRFRSFVAVYSQNMIAAGAGKNPNNPSDPGWDTAWNASLPADAATLTDTSGVQCYARNQTWTASPGANENLPINCLSWFVAGAFCIWDGGRLPTEAEWNYAAAGGNEQRTYPWGATEPGADANLAVYHCYYNASDAGCSVSNIAPVGSVAAGNGKWGQADLAGNLAEWTQDWYANPYAAGACNDCAALSAASYRVYRGGSFPNFASNLLSSDRLFTAPTGRSSTIGARCSRNAL